MIFIKSTISVSTSNKFFKSNIRLSIISFSVGPISSSNLHSSIMCSFFIHTLFNKLFFKSILKKLSLISRTYNIANSNSSPTITSNHRFVYNSFAIKSRNSISRSITSFRLFNINNSRPAIPSTFSNFVSRICHTNVIISITTSLSLFSSFKKITGTIIIFKISFKHIVIIHIHDNTIQKKFIKSSISIRNTLFFKSFYIISNFIFCRSKKIITPFINFSKKICSLSIIKTKFKSISFSIKLYKTITSININLINTKSTIAVIDKKSRFSFTIWPVEG